MAFNVILRHRDTSRHICTRMLYNMWKVLDAAKDQFQPGSRQFTIIIKDTADSVINSFEKLHAGHF